MTAMTETNLMTDVMDVVSPLHLVVNGTGHVVHSGPTVQKLFDGHNLKGARLLEQFEVTRPKNISDMAAMRETGGDVLQLRLRRNPTTTFKGVFLSFKDDEGGILALSFGVGLAEAVCRYELSCADFAPTDLAKEMLYLMEAMKIDGDEVGRPYGWLKYARDQSKREALTDSLTGLGSYRVLEPQVDHLIEAGEPFAVMKINLDRFQAINNTHGQEAGDDVLRQVASVVSSVTRARDLVVRLGGDEFLLVLAGLKDRAKLHDIADRLLSGISAPIVYDGLLLRISASLGTTLSGFYGEPNLAKMMLDADAAVQVSKSAGRCQHNLYEPGMADPDMPLVPSNGRDRRQH